MECENHSAGTKYLWLGKFKGFGTTTFPKTMQPLLAGPGTLLQNNEIRRMMSENYIHANVKLSRAHKCFAHHHINARRQTRQCLYLR